MKITKLNLDQLKDIVQTGIDPESDACKQLVAMLNYADTARKLLNDINHHGFIDDTDSNLIVSLNNTVDWEGNYD